MYFCFCLLIEGKSQHCKMYQHCYHFYCQTETTRFYHPKKYRSSNQFGHLFNFTDSIKLLVVRLIIPTALVSYQSAKGCGDGFDSKFGMKSKWAHHLRAKNGCTITSLRRRSLSNKIFSTNTI